MRSLVAVQQQCLAAVRQRLSAATAGASAAHQQLIAAWATPQVQQWRCTAPPVDPTHSTSLLSAATAAALAPSSLQWHSTRGFFSSMLQPESRAYKERRLIGCDDVCLACSHVSMQGWSLCFLNKQLVLVAAPAQCNC